MREASHQDPTLHATEEHDVPDYDTMPTLETPATLIESQLAPSQEQSIPEPSPEFPTREFLKKNFRKAELQKRCRELGISNIWTTKNQLIDNILQHSRSLLNDTSPDGVAHSPATHCQVTQAPSSSDLTQGGMDLRGIASKIENITSKLETKDMEIELLNTEVKTAYHTIELLQQRVTELEQRCCGSGDHQAVAPRSTSSNRCLLLGDTNLRPILRSDLHSNCCVRTIHDANMDLLTSWVTQKLSQIPSVCVLYSGIHDLLEESSPATILDNLGSLISALREKNSSMKVYVCQVVPSPTCQDVNAKIEDYNEQLIKWGEKNGIKVIKTVPTFKLGTGELEELCFDVKNDSYFTLNRLGAIKLLSTIKRQCPEFHLCTNWEQVKRTINTHNTQRREKPNTEAHNPMATSRAAAPRTTRADLPAYTTPTDQADPRVYNQGHSYAQSKPTHRAPHQPFTTSHRAPSYHRAAPVPRVSYNPTLAGATRGERGRTYAAALRRAPDERHHTAHYHSYTHTPVAWEWSRNNSPHYQSSTPATEVRDIYFGGSHNDRADRNMHDYTSTHRLANRNYDGRKRGCYNCGEFNHVQMNCRYDHKLLCGYCKRLGHKSRLCQQYST